MKNKSRLGKIAFASALVAASGGAALGLTSIASASLGSSPSVSPTAEPTAAPAHDTDRNTDDGQQADGRGEGHHRGPRLITENLAKVLKLSVEELRTQLMSGKTITQIADAQNVDIDDVKAVIVSDAEARLAEAVKDGKMTQDEADAKLTELKSKVDEIVTKVPQRRGDGHGKGHHRGPRLITENLAKVLKLSVEELRTQLMSGKSVTQIADAQNVDIDDVKAVIVSDAEARLAEAVKDGKMTQDEADAKLTELKSKVDEIVTKVPQRRGDGPRDHSHSPESGSNSSDGASFSA